MAQFYLREEFRNILGEDFYQYYRLNRNNRYEQLTNPARINATVQKMFGEMQDMLQECNHGIVLRNFGVIAPKESLHEDKENIFKVKYKKRRFYVIIFENEYFQTQYRPSLYHRQYKKEEDVKTVAKPRPYAVMLHRKKLRKNKLKNDGEDKS